MTNHLQVEELADGRVAVALLRSGQSFPEASGDPVSFSSPFGVAEREDIRWYLEDYLIAPYAVYEERGRGIEARLPNGASRCSRACSTTASRATVPTLGFRPK